MLSCLIWMLITSFECCIFFGKSIYDEACRGSNVAVWTSILRILSSTHPDPSRSYSSNLVKRFLYAVGKSVSLYSWLNAVNVDVLRWLLCIRSANVPWSVVTIFLNCAITTMYYFIPLLSCAIFLIRFSCCRISSSKSESFSSLKIYCCALSLVKATLMKMPNNKLGDMSRFRNYDWLSRLLW